VDTVQLMRTIIAASDAVGLAPAKDVAGRPGPDSFVRLDLDLPWLHGDYGFIRLRDRTPAPAEQVFMELTREIEAEVVASYGGVTAGQTGSGGTPGQPHTSPV
jgi:DNA-binding transcriptional LysR family regulator